MCGAIGPTHSLRHNLSRSRSLNLHPFHPNKGTTLSTATAMRTTLTVTQPNRT